MHEIRAGNAHSAATWPNRRDFLRLVLLGAPALSLAGAERAPIRAIFFAGSGTRESLLRGVSFGRHEAIATASLLRREFELEITDSAEDALNAREKGALLITGGLIPPVLAKRGGEAISTGPHEEATDEDTGLTWRVRPAPSAYVTALGRVSADLSAAELAAARAVAWHSSLFRYGAGELNERFIRQTGTSMEEESWLGWIAVKIALETSLRNQPVGSAAIDGHKGIMLRFDGSRHLQQPLYVVTSRDGREKVVDG